jgi:hypothetical protein
MTTEANKDALYAVRQAQADLRQWHNGFLANLADMQASVTLQITNARRSAGAAHHGDVTPPRTPRRDELTASLGDLSRKLISTPPPSHRRVDPTPLGSPQSSDKMPLDKLLLSIGAANDANGASPAINFDTLYEDLTNGDSSPPNKPVTTLTGDATVPIGKIMALKGQSQTRHFMLKGVEHGRPTVAAVANTPQDDPTLFGLDPNSACQMLVEFKGRRVLQYESALWVCPGEFVVVGGDRGEDIGLVIYAWGETASRGVQGIGLAGTHLSRSIGLGNGKVLRPAMPHDVAQMHTAQAELERRAVDVCTTQVLEHGLPMVIVDAEYQFDKKKLTFFYESQQRLDFRELVRDLFKIFRARIWLEPVEQRGN